MRLSQRAAKPITTKIHVTDVDNELIIIAFNWDYSSVLCHLKSGFYLPVGFSFDPGAIVPPGDYTLAMIGMNWGGPQKFTVTLTTDGQDTVYSFAPQDTAPGVTTKLVPITVAKPS